MTKYPNVKWAEVGELAVLACALSVVEFPFLLKTNMSRLKTLVSKVFLLETFMNMMSEVSEIVVVTAQKVA